MTNYRRNTNSVKPIESERSVTSHSRATAALSEIVDSIHRYKDQPSVKDERSSIATERPEENRSVSAEENRSVSAEEMFEAATSGVLRALESREKRAAGDRSAILSPILGFPIIWGIIIGPTTDEIKAISVDDGDDGVDSN